MTRRVVLDLGGLDDLWPGAGLYRYAVDLTHALAALAPPARFLVFGATPEPVADLRAVFRRAGWDYWHVPRAKGRGAFYRDQVRLAAGLLRARPDLCHCLHSVVPVAAVCPLVVTVQDMMYELFPDYAPALRTRPYRVFKWMVRNRVRRVVCPSQTSADDLARLWRVPRGRIDVVPHGLRVFGGAVERPENPALAALAAGPVISSPWNLEPRKNLAALLEAFALVRSDFPAARLVLYGRGGGAAERERAYRAALARLGPDGVVEPGVLSDPDLWWLYRRSDVFVFPTLYEGFGYPALEAMAAGACPVVRGCSSMAEVVGPAGVQVEPVSAAGLAGAVRGLLADGARRAALGESARARAAEFPAWKMAAGTYSSYMSVLRRRRAGT